MKYIRILPVLFLLVLLSLVSLGQAQQSTISFLTLGDSYTIGENVSPQERWPVQLAERLEKKGLKVDGPHILAVTGWTTLDLLQALSVANTKPPYDLISLLIGVNDQYKGYDLEDYPGNFRLLLEKAIELAGDKARHVLVLSIPDYGATPFGQKMNPAKISEEISAYNVINKKVSDSMGVNYVNITPASKQVQTQPDLVTDDGLHPSGKMYTQWIEQIMPVILPEIKSHISN